MPKYKISWDAAADILLAADVRVYPCTECHWPLEAAVEDVLAPALLVSVIDVLDVTITRQRLVVATKRCWRYVAKKYHRILTGKTYRNKICWGRWRQYTRTTLSTLQGRITSVGTTTANVNECLYGRQKFQHSLTLVIHDRQHQWTLLQKLP